MSASFLLISSYPKSGNTWTRLVFDHLVRGENQQLSINELHGALHGRSRRTMFDAYSPVMSSDLTFEEIENLLPDAFRMATTEAIGVHLVKVHECSHRNTRGEWLFPPDCVRAAIYLVRHPFDVAVSYANHSGKTVEDTAQSMARTGSLSSPQREDLELGLPQWMGSWSENVESWIDRSPYKTSIARYEDLHRDPAKEFSRVVAEAGLNFSTDQIEKAVAATRFEVLQEQEREIGFRERPGTSAVFFRAGRPGTWEGALAEETRTKIVRDHGVMMQRLGYFDDGSVGPIPEELRR